MIQPSTPGSLLRAALQVAQQQQRIVPFIGIFDLFSASLAADRFEALFLSGFGLAASAYGLPDIGFLGWGDRTSTPCLFAAPLIDALAAPRDLSHCHALLEANLRGAGTT